jgi:hypothetical protein
VTADREWAGQPAYDRFDDPLECPFEGVHRSRTVRDGGPTTSNASMCPARPGSREQSRVPGLRCPQSRTRRRNDEQQPFPRPTVPDTGAVAGARCQLRDDDGYEPMTYILVALAALLVGAATGWLGRRRSSRWCQGCGNSIGGHCIECRDRQRHATLANQPATGR